MRRWKYLSFASQSIKTSRYPLRALSCPLYRALRVGVWDSGGGLPIGHMTHIWKLFWRTPTSENPLKAKFVEILFHALG